MIALLLLFAFQTNAQLCSKANAPPPEFQQIKKQIDQKITQFANKKIIAEKADAMLSQLLTAKSPVITSWMKKHTTDSATEEQIVRAWREYFARNFILTAYPQSEKSINIEIEKLVDSITGDFAKKAFQERMQKSFEKAKSAAMETIKNFPVEEKTKIVDRIKSIKLYWPLNFKQARNNKVPLDIIDWGIAYDPISNEINMGINAMSYPNAESYLAVFAHEIGHSFDPIRWSAYVAPRKPWPFQKVGDCLRSDKGVGAKAGSGQQMDQLPESFADWFSAEVMAHLNLEDVSNLRSDLCDKHDLIPGSSYVSNEMRLTRIYFAQPALKAKIQGAAKVKDASLEKNSYCGLL